MDSNLDRVSRLVIKITGKFYAGKEMRDGWKKPLPCYFFKCPVHGIVKSYPGTHKGILLCPECVKNDNNKNEQSLIQDFQEIQTTNNL